MRSTAIYYVDFNAVDPETWHVRGSRQWTESPIAVSIKDYVLLKDDEGNTCYAWVTEFGEDAIAFELDHGTWRAYEETTQTLASTQTLACLSSMTLKVSKTINPAGSPKVHAVRSTPNEMG